MHDRDRRFHNARDAVEFSLGGAYASVDEAREQLERLASLVDDRAEVDALRGAIQLVAYAIEGLAVAVGQITPDGEVTGDPSRPRPFEARGRADRADHGLAGVVPNRRAGTIERLAPDPVHDQLVGVRSRADAEPHAIRGAVPPQPAELEWIAETQCPAHRAFLSFHARGVGRIDVPGRAPAGLPRSLASTACGKSDTPMASSSRMDDAERASGRCSPDAWLPSSPEGRILALASRHLGSSTQVAGSGGPDHSRCVRHRTAGHRHGDALPIRDGQFCSSTERTLPAGSLNHAMGGPPPRSRAIPFSSWPMSS
jgi:hypothetical protein